MGKGEIFEDAFRSVDRHSQKVDDDEISERALTEALIKQNIKASASMNARTLNISIKNRGEKFHSFLALIA